LHSAPSVQEYGRFCGTDRWTTQESERLLRLPLYYKIGSKNLEFVVAKLQGFFKDQMLSEKFVAASSE